MYVILMRCPRCKGTGLSRVPSMLFEPTTTETTIFGFGVPEKLRVRRTFPVQCRFCDGSGQMPVELPAFVDARMVEKNEKECGKDG